MTSQKYRVRGALGAREGFIWMGGSGAREELARSCLGTVGRVGLQREVASLLGPTWGTLSPSHSREDARTLLSAHRSPGPCLHADALLLQYVLEDPGFCISTWQGAQAAVCMLWSVITSRVARLSQMAVDSVTPGARFSDSAVPTSPEGW